MKRYCCCNDIRHGSRATAVFTLVYSVLFLGLIVWSYVDISEEFIDGQLFFMYTFYILFITDVAIVLTSCLVIVGVKKNKPVMLMTYIVSLITRVVIEVAFWAIALAVLGLDRIAFRISFAVFASCIIIQVFSLMCVIAQWKFMTRESREQNRLKPHTPIFSKAGRESRNSSRQQSDTFYPTVIDDFDITRSSTELQSYQPTGHHKPYISSLDRRPPSRHNSYKSSSDADGRSYPPISQSYRPSVDRKPYQPPSHNQPHRSSRSYKPSVEQPPFIDHSSAEDLAYYPKHGHVFRNIDYV